MGSRVCTRVAAGGAVASLRAPFLEGDSVEVTPHSIGKRGQAIAEHEGWQLRVRGGIPGERALVRILHVSRGGPVADAKFLSPVGDADPARREVRCPIHERCGGCGLQHMESFAFKIEAARALLPDAEWGEPIASPRGFRYRTKTFLLSDGYRFGVRPPRGNRLVDVIGCDVLRPEIEVANEWVREFVSPNEVRSALVRGNRAGDVQITLVHSGDAPTLKTTWSCMFLQQHDEPGNRICSDALETQIVGDRAIVERFAHRIDAAIPPTSFVQANPDVAELLYVAAANELVGSQVAEFYCGAGVAGLLAADRAHLTGIDRSPRAVEWARHNAKLNGLENKCEFHAVAAEEFEPAPWDSVLVNPPRAGCHPAVLETIQRSGADRLVYLSCNPKTLARDIEAMGWKLKSLRAADMLPQTQHIEILAVLER